MAIYTKAEFKSRLDAIVYTNGIGAVTAELLNELLTDFNDSVDSWVGAVTEFDPTALEAAIARLEGVPVSIDSDDLTETANGYTYEFEHGLATTEPFINLYNNGILYSPHLYSWEPLDANNVKFYFQESITVNGRIKP